MLCVLPEKLGLSESSCCRRVAAARLLARFPVVGEYLRDGRLGMTTLVGLRDVLDEDRVDDVLARAAGRTEAQVKELVATIRPRAVQPVDTVGAVVAKIEPVSEELRVLTIAVGREVVDDLARARDALSHKVPNGGVDDVLHECLRIALKALGKRRRGKGRGYVPAAVRDEVFRRDGHRCAFVAADGRRCGSSWQLELHHVVPLGKNGASTVGNLAVRCRAHNRYHAEVDFGREHVARAIERARVSG